MSDFINKSDIRKREYLKRTIYDGDQFYDLSLNIADQYIAVKMTHSSQTDGLFVSGKSTIEAVITDLQNALKLLEENA